MIVDSVMHLGFQAVVVCLAAIGGGGAIGGGTDGGGTSAPTDCSVDTKHDPGSAECMRSGYCGGNECCLTEFVIPPHDELVAGNKRIIGDVKSKGEIRHSKCDPPVFLLGLTFGWWTCELESTTDFGEYHSYTLAPCPVIEKPKSDKSDASPSGTGDVD